MTRYVISGKTSVCGSNALREASAEDLRVLLCLWEMGEGDAEGLAAAAGCSVGDAKDALAFWRGAGVVCRKEGKAGSSEKTAPSAEPPSQIAPRGSGEGESVTYTTKELAEKLERYQLRSLFTACQQMIGRECGRVEMNTIVFLHEQLRLDGDYILMLLVYCMEIGKYSFRYLEKVALSLQEAEITTVEALEGYIEKQRLYRSAEGKLRRLFGLGDRAPTARERGYFEKWINNFGYEEEVVGIAYDITVNNTGKAAMAYADKLLSNWHLAGCKNRESVEAFLQKEQAARGVKAHKPQKQADMSYDVEDAFAKALARSYGESKS